MNFKQNLLEYDNGEYLSMTSLVSIGILSLCFFFKFQENFS